ncbi:Kp4-domain-containing protein [Mycena rebaudengoi]|nr:Kp4-domain-containing protein [Mycena rebaudengoi]
MHSAVISLAVVLAAAGNAFAAPSNSSAAAIQPVSFLGINCRGSSGCSGKPGNVASLLTGYINGVSDATNFNNGQQIACVDSICAFLQNTNGKNGQQIKAVVGNIVNHGCTVCGSVPTDYPGGNDVSAGQLTFNFVSNPACTAGLC